MKNHAALFFLAAALSGCATYQDKVAPARNLMESGRAEAAAEQLKPLADKPDGDRLVYLLDYATALQAAGQIKESNRAYLEADKLADELDYQSVSRVTGSLLMSEEMKQYKGDTFEKIFINAQLALNFLQLGELDEALVESRRINDKYLKLRAEDKKDFELNPFAKYLSAVIWEADRKYDDAFIAYTEAYKISPHIGGIEEDLVRAAKLSRREDELAKYKKLFPQVKEDKAWTDRSSGEVVVIAQTGWGPRKYADPYDNRWPILRSVYGGTMGVRAEIADRVYLSKPVYDVQSAAIKTLEDDRASLVGRRLGGIVAKEVMADQIRQKDELLGLFAWVFMHASDRADLRQWSTLPREIQFIRFWLKPGNYVLNLQGLDGSGGPTGERLENRPVEVKTGRKTFVIWRAFR